ncbi:MAG: acetolactate synthase small subunit [Planctomycetales bacterium]
MPVVNGDDRTPDQVRKQLEKIVTVVKVVDFSKQTYVERDLMLIKVSTIGGKRSEVHELVDIFRGADRGRGDRSRDDRNLRPGNGRSRRSST